MALEDQRGLGRQTDLDRPETMEAWPPGRTEGLRACGPDASPLRHQAVSVSRGTAVLYARNRYPAAQIEG